MQYHGIMIHSVLIPLAQADTFQLSDTDPHNNLTQTLVVENIVETLSITIFSIAAAAFLLGALMYVGGFINEENKSKGKSLMIGSLVGMAVVLSVNTIFNTVYYFVYN